MKLSGAGEAKLNPLALRHIVLCVPGCSRITRRYNEKILHRRVYLFHTQGKAKGAVPVSRTPPNP